VKRLNCNQDLIQLLTAQPHLVLRWELFREVKLILEANLSPDDPFHDTLRTARPAPSSFVCWIVGGWGSSGKD